MFSLNELLKSTLNDYISRFGMFPTCVTAAPGRVNLIGEHTDYNGGFVFPLAIERYTVIAAGPKDAEGNESPAPANTATVWSKTVDAQAEFLLDNTAVPSDKVDWTSYVQGTIACCRARGLAAEPFCAVINSNVPLGGGLSSSASLEVAVATTLEALTGKKIDPIQKALLCQQAEHEYAKMPCGIMDQFISAMAEKDHAMLLDCRDQKTMMVPMADPNIVVLVANSNVKHELTGSEYPERRRSCEKAAELLGVSLLREASIPLLEESKEKFAAQPDGNIWYRRARHFLTEEKRTEALAAALMARNWKSVGAQMYAGHESLRSDYEVSCPELDLLVEIARGIGLAGGMIGSRMTGGGFGGCTVSLVDREKLDSICERMEKEYFEKTSIHPTLFATRPADGAKIMPLP